MVERSDIGENLPPARWAHRLDPSAVGPDNPTDLEEAYMQTSPVYGNRIGGVVAANANVDERGAFLVRTYLHLAGAIFAFVFIEAALFATGIADLASQLLFQFGNLAWLVVLVAFMAVGYLADGWARSGGNPAMQYAGLGLYVLAEAIITMPLLWVATQIAPGAIPAAGLVTLILFGGLTGIVFVTRKDFSFMKGFLGIAGLAAIGTIIAAMVLGFPLGVWFSGAMVLFAGGYILYYTSNVLHHYRTDQHVAAALSLFSALALLFWYVLRIFLASRR
jgi:FtsH-binding integral membrane protein